MKPCGKYYGGLVNGLDYVGKQEVNNVISIITTSGVVAQQINSNYILRFTIRKRTI